MKTARLTPRGPLATLAVAVSMAASSGVALAQFVPAQAPNPSASAAASPSNALTPEIVQVTVKESGPRGADVAMPVHVFKPTLSRANAGEGPWPVVIFSHGRASKIEERQNLLAPVLFGHVRYWHAKGYAVIAPIRPGYGDNSAHDPETSGTRYPTSGNGPCTGLAQYDKVVDNATRAVRSAHDWVREQPWANKDRVLLVGQSVGGLTTAVACGQNWPGVIGCVNFAGGHGGKPDTHANNSCQPDRLGTVFATAGKTTQVPSLWLYSENDQYWGPDVPKQWHKANVDAARAAGQKHTAEFFAAPPVEPDGHRLLAVGGRLWSPPLNAWLKKNGF
jgi:dienelactone hydrolase